MPPLVGGRGLGDREGYSRIVQFLDCMVDRRIVGVCIYDRQYVPLLLSSFYYMIVVCMSVLLLVCFIVWLFVCFVYVVSISMFILLYLYIVYCLLYLSMFYILVSL